MQQLKEFNNQELKELKATAQQLEDLDGHELKDVARRLKEFEDTKQRLEQQLTELQVKLQDKLAEEGPSSDGDPCAEHERKQRLEEAKTALWQRANRALADRGLPPLALTGTSCSSYC